MWLIITNKNGKLLVLSNDDEMECPSDCTPMIYNTYKGVTRGIQSLLFRQPSLRDVELKPMRIDRDRAVTLWMKETMCNGSSK